MEDRLKLYRNNYQTSQLLDLLLLNLLDMPPLFYPIEMGQIQYLYGLVVRLGTSDLEGSIITPKWSNEESGGE